MLIAYFDGLVATRGVFAERTTCVDELEGVAGLACHRVKPHRLMQRQPVADWLDGSIATAT